MVGHQYIDVTEYNFTLRSSCSVTMQRCRKTASYCALCCNQHYIRDAEYKYICCWHIWYLRLIKENLATGRQLWSLPSGFGEYCLHTHTSTRTHRHTHTRRRRYWKSAYSRRANSLGKVRPKSQGNWNTHTDIIRSISPSVRSSVASNSLLALLALENKRKKKQLLKISLRTRWGNLQCSYLYACI